LIQADKEDQEDNLYQIELESEVNQILQTLKLMQEEKISEKPKT